MLLCWTLALAIAADPAVPDAPRTEAAEESEESEESEATSPSEPIPSLAVPACAQWEISMYQLDCNGGLKGLPWWGRRSEDRRTCVLPLGWEPFAAGGLVTGGSEIMGNVTQPYLVMRRCVIPE